MEEVETGQTVKAAADRILSLMDGELPSDATHPEPEAQSEPEEGEQQQEAEPEPQEETAVEEPTETEEEPVTHFDELADHLNVEEDFLLNLEIPTKVNGEEKSATIKDLIAHYQKGESADLKLMDLAEQRKALEAEREQVTEQLQQEWGRAQALNEELQAMLSGDEANELEALRHSDPAEYAARVADRQQRLQRAEQIRQRLTQEQAQKINDQYARTVQIESQKILTEIPEWQDEKTAKQEKTQLREFLLNNGLKDWEIDGKMENGVITNPGIIDSRVISLARKAMLYDQSKKTSEPKKTKLKSLPKVGSGKRKTKGEIKQEQVDEIRGRVRKTGSMKDAALAIEQMMARGN